MQALKLFDFVNQYSDQELATFCVLLDKHIKKFPEKISGNVDWQLTGE